MPSEHAVHTAQGSHVPLVAAPSSNGPTTITGHDLNIMLLLALLEKGTMNADGRIAKYYGQQQADGTFEQNLMKAIEEGVNTAGGYTPYKGAEKVIDRYMKDHDMKNFDANRILVVYDLKNMNANLKTKDQLIDALVQKVAHDQSEVNRWQGDLNGDNSEIHHCEDKLSDWKTWFEGEGGYWTAKLAFYEAKKAWDESHLGDWERHLAADTSALAAQEEDESFAFSQTVYGIKDRAGAMKSIGTEESSEMRNSEENIMSFSAHFFVANQPA